MPERHLTTGEPSKSTARPVALITGTSSGFGLLTSVALANDGYHVVATMRSPDKCQELMHAAEQANALAYITVMKMDVTDEDEVRAVVRQIVEKFGRIDVLVNNAGYAAGGMIEEVDLDEWRRQFETNVMGVISCTQAVLPVMRRQASGTIVSVSSISGRLAMPGLGPYSASKFALEGLMESLRFEVAKYGIKVALVEPGPFRTNVWDSSLSGYSLNPDSPYREAASKLYRQVKHIADTAGDPMDVVSVIQQVIRTGAPRLRYPVGKGIRFTLAARKWLPWKLFERIVLSRV